MSHVNPSDAVQRDILASALSSKRAIAIVGASSDPSRPSYGVMKRLLAAGYHVIPVNPNERSVLGCAAVATLHDVKEPVGIVNVFRRPAGVPAIARDAAAIGAKVLWLQLGVHNDEAIAVANSAGITVVDEVCIAVAHAVLGVRDVQAAGAVRKT